MKLRDEQWEFLQDVSALINKIASAGFTASGGELWRPDEMQALYIKEGKSWTDHSRHQDRLAIDLNLFDGDDLVDYDNDTVIELANWWENLHPQNIHGLRTGWDDRDIWHFERRV